MKRFALLFASTFLAAPAFAADLTYEEPPAPAPVEIAPAYNWTSLYVGGQLGAAFGGARGSSGVSGGFNDDYDTFQGKRDTGFTGGGLVGYDYQIGNFLVGGVADFNYIDKDKKDGVVLEDNTANGADYTGKYDLDYFGTVRAKAGVAYDRVAIYGTGGLAYAKVDDKSKGDGTFVSDSGTAYDVSKSSDSDEIGYTVGAGADFLATPNISFGVEYLYTDLGKGKSKANFDAANSAQAALVGDPDSFSTKTKTDLDFHTVMAKAAYRFN